MRRFGDLLRLVSGLVLGLIVRDVDDITGNLHAFFYPKDFKTRGDRLAVITAVTLIALFLRNLHGSSVYDDWLARRGRTPVLERTRKGKVFTLCMLLTTLFVSPVLVAHLLSKHLSKLYSPTAMALLLFSSFAFYGLWNFFLWITDRDYSESSEPGISDLALSWLRVDIIALSVIALFATRWVYLSSIRQPIPTAAIGWCFCLVSTWTILADYVQNRGLYFPVEESAMQEPTKTVGLR